MENGYPLRADADAHLTIKAFYHLYSQKPPDVMAFDVDWLCAPGVKSAPNLGAQYVYIYLF
ncbi:MAG: hypothetical protein WBP85_03795 [Terracidiphilus sp.]